MSHIFRCSSSRSRVTIAFASGAIAAGVLAVCVAGSELLRADDGEQPRPAAAVQPVPRRPVATYSIVARDPDTGEMGVAVQSHWFSVGPIVPWAEAGVGAVATQSFVNVAHGPNGLALLRQGKSARNALQTLIAADEGRDVRQVAIVDARGGAAAYTGKRCIVEAGDQTGRGYSCQANLMEKDSVWPAMAAAFESAEGPLAERMLAALSAAEHEGGDIRGRQSAAVLVVAGTSSGRVWEDRLVDLRVEDHPDPVAELTRLLRLHRAYEHMNAGDVHMEHNDVEAAILAYSAALDLAPDVYEIAFWAGITMADNDQLADALPLLARAYRGEPRLRELVRRLPASQLLPDDPELIARLVAAEE